MKISAVLYAIVIIAFFMPFFMVSCEKTELLNINGIQLVTGGESKLQMDNVFEGMGKDPNSEQKPQKIQAQPMAIAAFVIAIIALLTSLLLRNKFYFIPVLLSIAGVLCLHLLKNGMMGVVSKADTGMGFDIAQILKVYTRYGFWVADIAFLGAAVTALLAGIKKKPLQIQEPYFADAEFSDPMAILPEDYLPEPEYDDNVSGAEDDMPEDTKNPDTKEEI